MLVVSILPVKYLKFKIIKLVIILLFYLKDLNDGLELLVIFFCCYLLQQFLKNL